jgi:hypothetical protein
VRNIVLALAALALTGCATKGVFLLADGRLPSDDPVLKEQLGQDLTICIAEAQKANLSGNSSTVGSIPRNEAVREIGRGCMAEKGYVLVRKEEVDSKRQELAAAATEKARLEAAAASSHRTTAIKPKPEQTPTPKSQ